MIYGHEGTIHRTKELNIEIDEEGKVVAVWFRCIALPFDVTVVNSERSAEMTEMYETNPRWNLLAVHVEN